MKLPLFNGYGGEPYKGLPEDRFKFLKHELVEGVGLYDLEARLYDPTLGRFAQVDPLPDDEGQESLTPYQYAWNNPTLRSDPDGRCPGCLEMLKKWWNSSATGGEQMVGKANADRLMNYSNDFNYTPKTKGEVWTANLGAGLRDFNNYGSFNFRIFNTSPTSKPQLALPAAKPQLALPAAKPNTKQLVAEAHSQLDQTAQNYKTTGVGVDSESKLYISSSDKTVPKPQRIWADKKGITVVNGEGHAEETLMNNVPNIEKIDASRGVCKDCQNMMEKNNVTTDTQFTGKPSKKRQ